MSKNFPNTCNGYLYKSLLPKLNFCIKAGEKENQCQRIFTRHHLDENDNSQFHQQFTSSFCTDFHSTIITSPNCKHRKAAQNTFVQKASCKKSWSKWHLKVFPEHLSFIVFITQSKRHFLVEPYDYFIPFPRSCSSSATANVSLFFSFYISWIVVVPGLQLLAYTQKKFYQSCLLSGFLTLLTSPISDSLSLHSLSLFSSSLSLFISFSFRLPLSLFAIFHALSLFSSFRCGWFHFP